MSCSEVKVLIESELGGLKMIQNVVNALVGESEASVQEELFRSLLQTPHRDVDALVLQHVALLERDPDFYGKLTVFALNGECDVRDINEVFLACLFNSQFPEHREAAYCLMQDLPPYQVVRVANIFTGVYETMKRHSYEASMPKQGENGVTYKKACYGKSHTDATKRGKEIPRTEVKLGKKSKLRAELLRKKLITPTTKSIFVDTWRVHRSRLGNRHFKGMLRRAVTTYLRLREMPERERQMEGALLRMRTAVRRLYAKAQLLPQNNEGGWVNQYLFKGRVVEGTRLAALKSLGTEKDPTKQAELILEHKLPFTSAVSVISNFTPSVWVSLIEVMSPQELMQQLGAMKRHGVYKNADLKKLVESKLKKATKKKGRVDALKGQSASKNVAGLDEDIRKAVEDVTDAQLKFAGDITADTALLIDKSTSMQAAIEIGKMIAATLAQACQRDPRVWLFDNMARQVIWRDADGDRKAKSAWDKKLQMFHASGSTSPHAVIKAMINGDVRVEQILVVTDEGENQAGRFALEMLQYEKHFGYKPPIVIMRLGKPTGYPYGSDDRMEKSLKAANFDVDVLKFPEPTDKAIATALPNLIRLLSRKSMFDLVQEIQEVQLPTKAQWDEKHNVKAALAAACA